MSKKSHKALASATVMSLILTSTLTATVSAATGVERLSGSNRETTAIDVATKVFEKAETVVLVNGYKSADALSATPLAKAYNAPILSVGAVDEPTAALTKALKDLGAKKVVVVGGEGAVTKALATKLAETYTVERIEGKDRYATNVNVAKKVMELKDSKEAFVVNGSDASYADALSIASIAASKGAPLVFTNGKTVSEEAKALVKGLEVTAIGGTGVVSADVLAAVDATRVGGADRFATNLEVLKAYKDVIKLDNVFVAYGLNFADALVASAAAAKTDAPVVLADKTNTKFTKGATDYIEANKAAIKNVYLVGGTGVISDSVKDSINEAVNGVVNNKDLAVESVTPVNLTQLLVKFTTPVDKSSATTMSNYRLYFANAKDTPVDLSANARVALKDDRTVLITLDGSVQKLSNQLKDSLEVKNVRSKDRGQRISTFKQEFSVVDLTAPTVASVEPFGNRAVKVIFSEDINATQVKSLSNYRLNGKSMNGYSASSITYDAENYTAVIAFGADLEDAKHELTVSYDNGITDYAALKLVETKVSFVVKKDESTPAIASSEIVSNPGMGLAAGKYVKVKFTKPLAADGLVVNGSRYTDLAIVDNVELDGTKYYTAIKNGDMYIRVTGTDALKPGAHTIRISQKNLDNTNASDDYYVVDAFGIKVPNNSTTSYTVEADTSAPEVKSITIEDKDTIVVMFTEDVDQTTAETRMNYTLKDKDGDYVAINRIDLNTTKYPGMDVVTIKTVNDLKPEKYTLNIKKVKDEAGNVMAEMTKELNVNDIVGPQFSSVSHSVKGSGYVLYVKFNESINKDDLLNRDNYNVGGKKLPDSAVITAKQDDKVAEIYIPTASDLAVVVNTTKVTVSNMKDLAGNKMSSLYQEQTITGVSNIAHTAYTTGEDARVKDARTIEMKLNKELANIDAGDFLISYDGVTYTDHPLATSTFKNESDGTSTVTLKVAKDLTGAVAAGKEFNTKMLPIKVKYDNVTGNTKALDNATFATGAVVLGTIKDKVAPVLDSLKQVTTPSDTFEVTFSENITTTSGYEQDLVVYDVTADKQLLPGTDYILTPGLDKITVKITKAGLTNHRFTAKLTSGRYIKDADGTEAKSFEAKIVENALGNDEGAITTLSLAGMVAADKAALTVSYNGTQEGAITLPVLGVNGSTITWAETTDAANVGVLAGNVLTITRSNVDDTDDSYVLTATITKGSESDTKVITLNVKEKKAPVVTGVTEAQSETEATGITPAFTEGTATLAKDGGSADPFTSGTKVAVAGSYLLTVTDAAGNVTTINFTITA